MSRSTIVQMNLVVQFFWGVRGTNSLKWKLTIFRVSKMRITNSLNKSTLSSFLRTNDHPTSCRLWKDSALWRGFHAGRNGRKEEMLTHSKVGTVSVRVAMDAPLEDLKDHTKGKSSWRKSIYVVVRS